MFANVAVMNFTTLSSALLCFTAYTQTRMAAQGTFSPAALVLPLIHLLPSLGSPHLFFFFMSPIYSHVSLFLCSLQLALALSC